MNDETQKLIEEYVAGNLSDDDCAKIERLALVNEEVAQELERALSPTARAFQEIYPPIELEPERIVQLKAQLRPNSQRWKPISALADKWFLVGRSVRLVGISGLACASLAYGAWLSAPWISAWRFPGGEAMPVRESIRLIETPKSESGANQIGAWTIEGGNLTQGFASLDETVSHSGGASLRLLQKEGSGDLRRTVDVPLPAGTTVTFGAWILAPRGGNADNKYFTMGIESPDGPAQSKVDILDASPVWRPYVLTTVLTKPVRSLSYVLEMTGYGSYKGWNWATWVDDVFLGVLMPIPGTYKASNDGVFEVDATLPVGFSANLIDGNSIRLRATYDDPKKASVVGEVIRTTDSRHAHFIFRAPEEIATLDGSNPDTKGPSSGAVLGRVQYGRYSVPFMVSIYGPVSTSKPAVAP